MEDELLEVVDAEGRVLRLARRSEVHGDPSLMHRVAHVLVLDGGGRILLQKRSMTKDVAPGRWDTSVGGHMEPGESPDAAARREMREELGVEADPAFLYSYVHTNPYETELVYTFSAIHPGVFVFDEEEIDEVRFFDTDEIARSLGTGFFSDNFEHEFRSYKSFVGKGGGAAQTGEP